MSKLGRDKLTRQELISAQLENLEAIEAIKVSLNLLTALSEDVQISREEYFKCLQSIESANHLKIKDITHKRLNVKVFNKDASLTIDAVVYPYYRRLFLDYTAIVNQMISQKVKVFSNQQDLALLLYQTINAAFNMSMWRYFDDELTPSDTYLVVNKMFKYAEYLSVLHVPLNTQHSKEHINIAYLYVANLMLGTLQKGNYSANEVYITSKLLLGWLNKGITLDKAYATEKHFFFVNLNADKGADRVRAFERTADYRYWQTASLIEHIEKYIAVISSNQLPSDSGIRALGSMPVILRLLKKLNQDWSPKLYKRQRRDSERAKTDQSLFVINGLDRICKNLAQFNKQEKEVIENVRTDDKVNQKVLTDFSNLSQISHELLGVEEWALVDVSDSGFGVNLGRNPSNWIAVGKLVGCQHPKNHKKYVISEIKSIKKQKNGTYRAGIQIISMHSQVMNLIKSEKKVEEVAHGFYLGDDNLDHEFASSIPCLFIPKSHLEDQVKTSVIIPSIEYEKNRKFAINLEGREKTMVLGVAVDMNTDWVRATIASLN